MPLRYTRRDLVILALTIWGEARGEPLDGRRAVAWTVRNRVEADLYQDGKVDWWGEGVAGVCLQPWQYSCWNQVHQGQSQRERMLRFLLADDLSRAELTAEAAQNPIVGECMAIAEEVLEGRVPDPTRGATHYYATWIPEPKWAQGREPSALIGPHRFYADIEPGYEPPANAVRPPDPSAPMPFEQPSTPQPAASGGFFYALAAVVRRWFGGA